MGRAAKSAGRPLRASLYAGWPPIFMAEYAGGACRKFVFNVVQRERRIQVKRSGGSALQCCQMSAALKHLAQIVRQRTDVSAGRAVHCYCGAWQYILHQFNGVDGYGAGSQVRGAATARQLVCGLAANFYG